MSTGYQNTIDLCPNHEGCKLVRWSGYVEGHVRHGFRCHAHKLLFSEYGALSKRRWPGSKDEHVIEPWTQSVKGRYVNLSWTKASKNGGLFVSPKDVDSVPIKPWESGGYYHTFEVGTRSSVGRPKLEEKPQLVERARNDYEKLLGYEVNTLSFKGGRPKKDQPLEQKRAEVAFVTYFLREDVKFRHRRKVLAKALGCSPKTLDRLWTEGKVISDAVMPPTSTRRFRRASEIIEDYIGFSPKGEKDSPTLRESALKG